MKVSKSTEEFFIENLRLSISKPNPNVTVPAYDNSIRIRYMEPIKEGGDS
jgi:hypothetical protein